MPSHWQIPELHDNAGNVDLSGNGQENVRYRNDLKRAGVARLGSLIATHTPWLSVRHAF